MADLSLVFDLLARDKASPVFDKVGDSARKAGEGGSRFGKLITSGIGVATGALIGAGLVDTMKGFYDAAADSARIGRLTNQVLKSTGGVANVTATQVGNLATALSNKTGMDDEDIQSAENLLLTFTNVRNEAGKGNDVFNQTSAAALDMSAALGTSASGAAMQLGKALNNPIKGVGALSRAGVTFTKAQKDQIKTLVDSGKTLDAQKIILHEVSKEFGGAAAAAATPWDRLKVSLGNLQEQIGGYLIPIFGKLADGVMEVTGILFSGTVSKGPFAPDSPVVKGLFAVRDGAQQAGKWVQSTLWPALKNLGQWFTDHQAVIFGVAQTIGGILVGAFRKVAGAAVATVKFFAQHSGALKALGIIVGIVAGLIIVAWTAQAAVSVAQSIRSVFAWFRVAAASTTSASIQERSTAQIVTGWLIAGARAMLGAAKVVAGWVWMAAQAVANGLRIAAVWTAQIIRSAVVGAASFAIQVARVVGGWVLMAAQSLIQAARMAAAWFIALGPVGWVIAAVIGIVVLIIANWKRVVTWTTTAWRAVSGAVVAAWHAVTGAIATAWAWILARLSAAWAWVRGAASAAWNAVVGVIRGAWSAITGVIRGAWGAITGAVGAGMGRLGAAVRTGLAFVWNAFKALPGRILGVFAGAGRWLWGAGTSMIQGLINGAGSLLRNIGRMFLNIVPGFIRGPFEHALGIGSPSKIFHQYGINIGQGLVNGLTGSHKQVQTAATKLADALTKGYADYRKKRAAGLAKLLTAGDAVSRAEAQTGKGRGVAVAIARRKEGEAAKALLDLNKTYGQLGDRRAVTAAVARIRAGDDMLVQIAKRREVIANRLKAAQGKLADALKVRNDYAASIRDAAAQTANITTDVGTATTSGFLVDRMRTQLAAIRTFRTDLQKLSGMGLSNTLYKQIADAGVEQGGATAQALLSGGKGAVTQVNSLSKSIQAASAGLGTDTSKKLYQAGVDAATGLVRGLSAQSTALTRAADTLAARLTAAIKAKLGIRSPSTVFQGVGVSIGQGLADGIASMQPTVAAELAALTPTVTPALGYRPPGYDLPAAAAGAGGGATYVTTVSGVASPEAVAAQVVRAQRTNEFLAGVGT